MVHVLSVDRLQSRSRHDRCLVVSQTRDGWWGVTGQSGEASRFATKREAIYFALYGSGRSTAQAVLLVPPIAA